ncbi:hypothetical protein Tco_1395612, partial [Tanacetum coccineum]
MFSQQYSHNFADVTRSSVESSGLSHDESFGVDDLDLNLNEPVNLNVSQIETKSKLLVSEEPDVGRTHELIVAEVRTQEPIVKEGNGQDDESVPSDGQFFYDDEGIDTAYETEYDVQSSEDACTNNNDDDKYEDLLVDEENEIVEPDVDVYLFGISMDVPFDNIGVTNLVPDDVLEEEGVDVINLDDFESGLSEDDKISNYRMRRRNLKLYKNDNVMMRARFDRKVHVFTMSQGTGPTGPNYEMEAGPSGSSGLKLQISMSKTFRAKAKAKRDIRGGHVLQYFIIRDYVVELQSTNLNTTVKIAVEKNTDPSLPTRVFQRIYVCFGALTVGFRACRKDLLGLDGVFMKDPFPGQVLAAAGLDSNNCLGDDIDLHSNSNFTFISDRQKGIIPAIRTVFLSRAKSDLLLNNICEVFNGKIVGGRDKPVITLLKYIRNYCMKRIVNVQSVIDKCTGPLTPTATRIMESIKKDAHLMKVQWNGGNKYRVSAYWNMALNDRAAPPLEAW